MKLPHTAFGEFAERPEIVRFSLAVRRLRAAGAHAAADELERDRVVAAVCNVHGRLPDPVICLVGERVAFACPDCSGALVKAQWLAEGRGGVS